jgi:hypothetical protein
MIIGSEPPDKTSLALISSLIGFSSAGTAGDSSSAKVLVNVSSVNKIATIREHAAIPEIFFMASSIKNCS